MGVVGTPFKEHGTPVYDYRFVNIEHVSGACQVFRRKCFEEIGGYTPVEGGGIDYIAVTTARMKGWSTRTFTEKVCRHHRQMGTAGGGVLAARFRTGVKDYALGNHPLWEMFRVARQMGQPTVDRRGPGAWLRLCVGFAAAREKAGVARADGIYAARADAPAEAVRHSQHKAGRQASAARGLKSESIVTNTEIKDHT